MPDNLKVKTKSEKSTKASTISINNIEVVLPTPQQLIESGAHWGHLKHRVFPKNYKNISGIRSNAHIIDVYKTLEDMRKAIAFMKILMAQKKQILFVATKPSIKLLVKEFGQKMDISYVDERWVGGTFTNSDFIEKSINKLKKLEADFESGEINKYPRHEQLEYQKELERLQVKFGGIKSLKINNLGAVFIHDLKRDKIALKEALQSQIPVIAFVDTNINPQEISYPIPCNDDSYETFKLFLETLEKNLG